jgi:Clp amino terminal domain, pathogenicity island component
MTGRRGASSEAFAEAARLGSRHVGPEHFLLALLRPGEETVAAEVLRDCGADYEALSSVLESHRVEGRREGISMNPVAHELVGRAEGLAAGLGDESVTVAHVLLALVWGDRHGWPLAAAGTTREAVYEGLQSHDARLTAELPPTRPLPAGPRQVVHFPQTQLLDVLRELPPLLPPETHWGWNLDGDFRAYVEASGDFDLRQLVRRALNGAPA